jgi:hypothetical protein
MKIIIEKVNQKPNHSVTKNDVRIVIKHVPANWIGVAHVFKISSQFFDNSQWDRPVIENNTTFIIMSRGFERNYIIKELLIEMALFPSGIYGTRAHHLNNIKRKKLEEIVHPLFVRIIEELNKLNIK